MHNEGNKPEVINLDNISMKDKLASGIEAGFPGTGFIKTKPVLSDGAKVLKKMRGEALQKELLEEANGGIGL